MIQYPDKTETTSFNEYELTSAYSLLKCLMSDDAVVYTVIAVQVQGTIHQIYKLIIRVLDTNDHAPTFPDVVVLLNVSETSPAGTRLLLPVAEDADSDTNGEPVYHLEPSSARQQFDVSFTSQPDGSQQVKR